MSDVPTLVLGGSVAGIGGGLWLLARGFAGYQRAGRVADTATSRIATLAVGEVRVTGWVEPAELTLTSPLKSVTCVYYRARVNQQQGRLRQTVLDDERAVGFRIRDASGAIRVFPRGTTWDVQPAFKEGDGMTGDPPPGLSLRSGSAIGPATPDRDSLVADLLTVQPALGRFDLEALGGSRPSAPAGIGGRRRDYEEARIEPGDTVTIVGTALPFNQLPDPDGADVAHGMAVGGTLAAAADPEIAADIEAAQAAGTLKTNPAEAWGNAAIPGFGIGEPVRAPDLDPEARPAAVADPKTAERFQRTFEIAPGELVLAVGTDRPMLISAGPPAAVITRARDRFLVGLLGVVLAIGSAVVLAIELSAGIPR